jgi:hypothetical protein
MRTLLAALIAALATVTSVAAPVSATPTQPPPASFVYTGAAQSYVVPDGVTQLRVVMRGGEGGDGTCTGCLEDYRETNVGGGLASIADYYITVVPNETLKVYVGGAGSDGGLGGWNGGGDGTHGGAGGGGASDVRRAPYGLDDRLIIAAGGGGGGAANTVGATFPVSAGGHGGASRGYDGSTCFPYPLNGAYPNASGGGLLVGGAGGLGGKNGTAAQGGSGTKGDGGDGAAPDTVHFNPLDPWSGGGGGGGGGYFGGGGGGGSSDTNQGQLDCAGGGAGGSSYPGYGPSNTDQHGNGAATLTPGIAMFLPTHVDTFVGGAVDVGITTATTTFTPKFSIVGALPSWLELVDNGDGTASVRGTPPAGTAGTYEVTVRASNPSGPAVDPLRSERKIVIVVAAAASRLTLTTIKSSANPALAGDTIDFTVKVVPESGSGTPHGTVQLREGGAPFGAAKSLNDGKAVFHVAGLSVGTHAISAIYSGDAVFNTSTSAAISQAVAEPGYRPDARVRAGTSGSFLGNDTYNGTGAGQTVSKSAKKGKTLTFQVSIQNDGTAADKFTVSAAGSGQGYTVKYKKGSTNITSKVVAGTWTTPKLAPGATVKVTVKITITSAAAKGSSLTRLLTVSSVANAALTDSVGVSVSRK